MYSVSRVLPFLSLSFYLTTLSAGTTIQSRGYLEPRQGIIDSVAMGVQRLAGGGSDGGTANGQTADGGCGKYVIVSARGTTEKQVNPRGNAGFIKGLMQQAPGGTNYEVVYPASTDFGNGPKIGVQDAMQFINKQKTKCPKQPMVLIGYSQGAMVVHQLVNEKSFPLDQVSSVILYGSPLWEAGKPYDKGTATSGQGIFVEPGMPPVPAPLLPKIQDICFTADIFCTSAGSIAAHLKYTGSPNENEAIAFSAKLLQSK